MSENTLTTAYFVPPCCLLAYYLETVRIIYSALICCHVFRSYRSDTDRNRRVSPHSERRSLQPHNDALPEAEAQEQKTNEGAEEAHAPPSDPGPDCLTRGRGSHENGESRGAHTACKYLSSLTAPT